MHNSAFLNQSEFPKSTFTFAKTEEEWKTQLNQCLETIQKQTKKVVKMVPILDYDDQSDHKTLMEKIKVLRSLLNDLEGVGVLPEIRQQGTEVSLNITADPGIISFNDGDQTMLDLHQQLSNQPNGGGGILPDSEEVDRLKRDLEQAFKDKNEAFGEVESLKANLKILREEIEEWKSEARDTANLLLILSEEGSDASNQGKIRLKFKVKIHR